MDEPRIVETDGVLGGDPRIDRTSVGVYHVRVQLELGETVESIASDVYPHLTVEQVAAAAKYAREHVDEMEEIQREREEMEKQLREEARREKQRALGRECPECGGELTVAGEPLALITCKDCEGRHVVDRILDSEF